MEVDILQHIKQKLDHLLTVIIYMYIQRLCSASTCIWTMTESPKNPIRLTSLTRLFYFDSSKCFNYFSHKLQVALFSPSLVSDDKFFMQECQLCGSQSYWCEILLHITSNQLLQQQTSNSVIHNCISLSLLECPNPSNLCIFKNSGNCYNSFDHNNIFTF